MIYFDLIALSLLPLAFWAGHEWGKRRYQVPLAKAGHTDEFLYRNEDGAFVPYHPPRYVPEGMNPVAAGWEMTRKTGVPHHTRRVASGHPV